MAYGDIVHLNVWRQFFADASENTYSIYMHSKNNIPKSELPGCILIPTQPTEWGKFSLMDVQHSLFLKAHEDPDNYKFILLSSDTVPLYTFSRIYAELTKDNKGRMNFSPDGLIRREVTVDKSRWPADIKWNWMHSPQWIILNRSHIAQLHPHWEMLKTVFNKSEIPDEHLYPIFFNGYNYNDTFSPTIMYSTFTTRSKYCSIHHRDVPRTFHTEEFDSNTLDVIYGSGAMFIRKICSTALLNYDWSLERPLIPASPRRNTKFTLNKYGFHKK